MKKTLFILAVAVVPFLAIENSHAAVKPTSALEIATGENKEKIDSTALPQAVLTAWKSEHSNAVAQEIYKVTSGDKVFYEITYVGADSLPVVSKYNADGSVMLAEATPAAVPTKEASVKTEKKSGTKK